MDIVLTQAQSKHHTMYEFEETSNLADESSQKYYAASLEKHLSNLINRYINRQLNKQA